MSRPSFHSISPFPGFEDKDISLKEAVDNQESAKKETEGGRLQ